MASQSNKNEIAARKCRLSYKTNCKKAQGLDPGLNCGNTTAKAKTPDATELKNFKKIARIVFRTTLPEQFKPMVTQPSDTYPQRLWPLGVMKHQAGIKGGHLHDQR